MDDKRAFPLYERCAEYGMIMLFHGGADWGFQPPVKAPPQRMRAVADAFPQAKIVVAHLGGQDMAEDAIRYLADSSVYIDTSFTACSVPVERSNGSSAPSGRNASCSERIALGYAGGHGAASALGAFFGSGAGSDLFPKRAAAVGRVIKSANYRFITDRPAVPVRGDRRRVRRAGGFLEFFEKFSKNM